MVYSNQSPGEKPAVEHLANDLVSIGFGCCGDSVNGQIDIDCSVPP